MGVRVGGSVLRQPLERGAGTGPLVEEVIAMLTRPTETPGEG